MKNKKIEDLNELRNGIKIANLEGKWIKRTKERNYYDAMVKLKNGKEYKQKFSKIYTASMPYSLEIIRTYEKYKDRFYTDDNGIWTDLFINLKFNKGEKITKKTKDGLEKEIKINKKNIRKDIYMNNFTYNEIEYTFFKRGGSKARTANVIMVDKRCYDELFKPCLLGLDIQENEEIDLTSLEAYISLIMSSIIGTINIKSEEILIINDIMSKEFKAYQTITTLDGQGKADYYNVVNNMTDGQGLMDESLFTGEILEKATTCLLRNDFLKCNTVRTRLQQYYKGNGITKVWDMYRGWLDASKIKLVITPSSCKYLKFANKFESEKECYLNWLKEVPEVYGIVKIDHVGNYGYSNKLSYQMINSMNFNRTEVRELIKPELDYLKLLINNSLVDSKELKMMTKDEKKEEREIRNKMSYYIDTLGNSDELNTDNMLDALLNRNIDYRLTDTFKTHKKHKIENYIGELRKGKIRIKNSLYAIMVSCPYTMLKSTIRENNIIVEKEDVITSGAECYCPAFRNHIELLSIRNPQVNGGNIYHMTNKYHDEYKWFGYKEDEVHKHDFVVFINSWDADIMNRLQGADWDVDTTFLTDNNLLVEKARENEKYATPVNGIKGSKMMNKYNLKSLAKLDNYLGQSTMNIGKIINKSAIFNAYMYNAINTGKGEEYIKACYNASSSLSSYSQIAIDMAKKSFIDENNKPLSLNKMMIALNSTQADGEQILQFEERKDKDDKTVKDMIVPYFFKFIAEDNSHRVFKKMECAMDYLEDILDNFKIKAMQTDKINTKDLLVEKVDGRANIAKIDKVRDILSNTCGKLNGEDLLFKPNDTKEELKRKSNLRKWIKKTTLDKIKLLNLNNKTIYKILARAFDIDIDKDMDKYVVDENGEIITYIDKEGEIKNVETKKFKNMVSLTLTILYNAYPISFINCFSENNDKKELSSDVKRYW